jgi:YD repeat-containing protein
MMSHARNLRLTTLMASMVVATAALAGGADGQRYKKQINGPSVTNDPGVTVTATVVDGKPVSNDPGVTVTATVVNASSHWLPVSTGNGYLGHAFVSANRSPSSVVANNPSKCPGAEGDPILIDTGTKIETYPLFQLPGEMGLGYILYYNTATRPSSWTDNLFYSLDTSCSRHMPDNGRCTTTTVYRPDGSSLVFDGDSTATTYPGVGVTRLTRDPSTGNYTFHDEDATTQVYSASGSLRSITNASGIGWTLSYNGNVTTVTHTGGQSFTVRNDNGVATVTDPGGNAYTIQGARSSTLASITYPGSPGTTVAFKYTSFTSPPYMPRLSEVDYNGVPHSFTTYDTAPNFGSPNFPNVHYQWATGTYLADGSERVGIAYYEDNAGVRTATVTNPLGHQSVKTYDSNGNITLISGDAVQTCGATVSGRTYDNNNHLTAEIDNNGNTHTYVYAANGQLQTETEAYGTPIARTTDYVWDPNPTLNRPLSITTKGWKKTVYTYNAQNRLGSVSVTNLSSAGTANETLTTTYGYTLYGNGLVQTMTVTNPTPMGTRTDTYSYDPRGNMISAANGLGQATAYSNYNGMGQPGRIVGPNGDVIDLTYDARSRVVTKTTYANGTPGAWTYTYDGLGLLYTLSTPDGQVTTWNRDPVTMRVTTIRQGGQRQ